MTTYERSEMDNGFKLCPFANHIEFKTIDDAIEFTKDMEFYSINKTTIKEKGIYENEEIFLVCYK